jgi:UDP-GlcNAc:undecaprenyl-phosphate GlcNAc-1-phosphate transferase
MASTALCIVVLKPLAPKLGLVDHPIGRKKHDGVIPLVGGIAIWISFAIVLLFIGVSGKYMYFVVAGGLLMVVGAVDDVLDLAPKLRLVLHVVAALIMCTLAGVVVKSLGEIFVPRFDLALGILAIPFTVFAVVGLINSVNMCDGIDGHCGTQVFVPLAGLAVLAGVTDNREIFLPLVALCGCIVGFLLFNLRTPWRSKAAVFLGDAGSNFLGFSLAWFLIDLSQGDNAVLAPVSVLWFAILLIYDTIEVVARRLLRRKSPFHADNEHLHHVFLLAGFSVSETVLTMGAISLVGVLIGIATAFVDVPDSAQFAAFLLFGLLFLRMIFRTWSVMQFLYRSICRRQGERRRSQSNDWNGLDRRTGRDRRSRPRGPNSERQ